MNFRNRNVTRITSTVTLHYADGSRATVSTELRSRAWPGGWDPTCLNRIVENEVGRLKARARWFATYQLGVPRDRKPADASLRGPR